MKLRQGQTWKLGEQFIRIARLERLSVEFKTMTDLISKQGEHQKTTKKAFCRLIKNAALLTPQEVAAVRDINSEQVSAAEIEESQDEEKGMTNDEGTMTKE